MSPISKAQQKHVHKYVKKNYDRTTITVKKGDLNKIKAAAESVGESTNKFITTAIHRRIAEELGDDEFCRKLHDDYLANPDKGEPMPIEEFAAELGITL